MPASIDPEYARNIGQLVAEARHTRGLTQKELGRRIGNSKNAVSSWERGESAPTVQNIRELCRELDVAPAWLLLMNDRADRDEAHRAAIARGRQLQTTLSEIRARAENAFPDLLTALKEAEEEARRIVEPE